MPIITIDTHIQAPINIVFDLARSIELHSISVSQTAEKAIAGRTSGLIEKGETVTWEATHFGVRQQLQSIISEMDAPYYFRDEMLKGAFKSIYHEHIFEKIDKNNTKMIDLFNYKSPYGIIGRFADFLFLKKYMHGFLFERNETIKKYAESDQWRDIIQHVD